MIWIAVAVGGALGSAARHGVSHWLATWTGAPSPYATAAVNLSGAFIIGLLAGLLAGGHIHESVTVRAFVFVGILGGFTTFSTLMLDTFTLVEAGRTAGALANVLAQMIAGYALTYVGFVAGLKA
jgi:CrcB protein